MRQEHGQSTGSGCHRSSRAIGQYEHRWRLAGQRQPYVAYRRPPRRTVAQEPAQLVEPVRKCVPRTTRECSGSTRCNGALLRDTEVDPTRVRRSERSELFSNDQRLVVGQKEPAGSQPDAIRSCSQDGCQHRRCCTADASDTMLLPYPEPAVPEVISGQCDLRRLPERGRSRLTGQLRYDVQHRVSRDSQTGSRWSEHQPTVAAPGPIRMGVRPPSSGSYAPIRNTGPSTRIWVIAALAAALAAQAVFPACRQAVTPRSSRHDRH